MHRHIILITGGCKKRGQLARLPVPEPRNDHLVQRMIQHQYIPCAQAPVKPGKAGAMGALHAKPAKNYHRAPPDALAVEKAKRDVDRLTPLGQKGYASTQHVADARTALDAARADQRAVEFDRSLAHITAPADGVVLARHAEGREMVSPGAPILTVSSGADSFVLKAGLSDRDMARVKIGDPAIIRLDAFDGAELKGQVSRLAAESDPRSGAFEAEISFVDPDRPLVSGFMGRVQIQPATAGANAAAVSIPASAILEGHGSQASVFLVNPQTGQVERRRLTVSRLRGENILVTGGLSPDSVIVTAGAAYLHEGASVRIIEDLAALQ